MKRLYCPAAAVLLVMLLMLPASPQADAQPRRGGVFRMAHIGEPPSLDLQATTAAITYHIMLHVAETLFAMDSKFETRPLLVDTWTMSRDRLTYTFNLRRGVRFHHGREMTSDDVVASLARWGRLGVRGRALFGLIESLTAPDPHTVVIKLREPYALLVLELAFYSQAAVIYPKDVLDEAGTGPLRRIVGTGPYRLAEHLPDRHIRMDRFEQYAARTDEPDGTAGRRTAYFDSIFVLPVPDPAVRLAGVKRGEFQFAESIPTDEYDRIRGDPDTTAYVAPLASFTAAIFNKRMGIMTNPKVRRAFLAALDMDSIMRATFGNPRLWRLDSSLVPKEHRLWSDAGKEFYNQKNPSLARQLLAEAGYRGEPVRWLTTMEYTSMGIPAQVAKPMLERAGFAVDLQMVDWATLLSRRARADLWDVFSSAFSFFPDPLLFLVLSPTYAGWYESRSMQAHLTLMRRHADPKVRADIWHRAQRLFWEEVPTVKFGDYFPMHVHRKELKGYTGIPTHSFWNVWLEGR